MAYSKITHGFVEQIYDDEGNCTEQFFHPTGSVDRRDENDEAIEDQDVIAEIEAKEKYSPLELVPPPEKLT